MFISLIRRNGKKNRRENSIYFLSLAITIVAFYIILSLEDQDVMAFLRRMESDAVNRLLGLISGVYGFSLFILFFLIYFAEKYQFERRSREFGMLLMLGMKRSRLFLWLMAEDFYSSGMALAIGLPTAVFLSEVISLITARLIGLGIIGHHFALSARGISLTVLGFLGIKLMANILLSTRLIRREPYRLLNETQEEKLKSVSRKRSFATLILGFLLLAIAYGMAIGNLTWMHLVFPGIRGHMAYHPRLLRHIQPFYQKPADSGPAPYVHLPAAGGKCLPAFRLPDCLLRTGADCHRLHELWRLRGLRQPGERTTAHHGFYIGVLRRTLRPGNRRPDQAIPIRRSH